MFKQKAFWTMLKKTALFLHGGFPYGTCHRQLVQQWSWKLSEEPREYFSQESQVKPMIHNHQSLSKVFIDLLTVSWKSWLPSFIERGGWLWCNRSPKCILRIVVAGKRSVFGIKVHLLCRAGPDTPVLSNADIATSSSLHSYIWKDAPCCWPLWYFFGKLLLLCWVSIFLMP